MVVLKMSFIYLILGESSILAIRFPNGKFDLYVKKISFSTMKSI